MTSRTKPGTPLKKNLKSEILAIFADKDFHPITQKQIFSLLSVTEETLKEAKKALRQLIKKGVIYKKEDLYHKSSSTLPKIQGVISVHPRGFGFVSPEDSLHYPEDIFIPKNRTKGAVNGDQVTVRILSKSHAAKGPEGEVIAIVKRARSELAGTITKVLPKNRFVVHVPLLGEGSAAIVSQSAKKSKKFIKGDRITFSVDDWGDEQDKPVTGTITKHLGHIDQPSADIKAAIAEYGLRGVFPKAVINEAKSWGKQVSQKEIAKREDLRHLECVTVDPTTAKDFDDAISLTKDRHGRFLLGVHIADVSHYVQPGTELDKEAKIRSNSTYFPGYCTPMLPPDLSDNLCSLKPNVNRLTVSVFMTFDSSGNLLRHKLCRSVIKSKKRFSYEEAKQVLDGKKRSCHKPLLEMMVELCSLLKKQRALRGSIEFALNDVVIKVDEKGKPTGTEIIEYDITHQMIEEFMLKANEVIAKHLSDQGKGVTFRIHEEPDPSSLKDFSTLAQAFGFSLPEDPSPFEIQQLFDEALQTAYGQYLAVGYIRSMKLAYYSPNNIGHYGLSLQYYCHFTSPIRRYVDLVAHRSLFNEGLDAKQLAQIAEGCSEQERLSARAENSVKHIKKLRLLLQYHKKKPFSIHQAVITNCRPFGVAFELEDLMIDGFIHISNLGNDYFLYNAETMSLTGENFGTMYKVGEPLSVILEDINLITGECSWDTIAEEVSMPKKKKKSKRNRKKR